jgi:hypothetical protein
MQEELVIQARDRHHLVVADYFARNQTGDVLRYAGPRQVNGRNVEDTAHRHDHFHLADEDFSMISFSKRVPSFFC